MYKHILVPVDGSGTARRGLEEAIALAGLTGGQLRLLHVVDELSVAMSMSGQGVVSPDLYQLLREGGEQVLADALALAQSRKVVADTVLIEGFSGRLCDHVLEQARQWGADIVVLGSHGRRGVGRLVMGSDAEQIIRTALVPVLVVRSVDPA
ncbi:MAG: universal stress protein [Rhodoferax sp.]|jgi:nucleotide-binding universal stress UspA family protein|nr:universal stress protein [Rhodoferax sp.]